MVCLWSLHVFQVNVLEKPQEREEQLQDFARRGGSREDAGFDAWGLILDPEHETFKNHHFEEVPSGNLT